ncbi:MAG: DUF1990 domain-containing protein [Planctomycetota bacterium]
MFQISRPNASQLQRFLHSQQSLQYTHPAVGGTLTGEFPAGFDVNQSRVSLGYGEAVFNTACNLLGNWQMFPTDWTQVYPSCDKIRVGDVVVVAARAYQIWWLNACRVVYTIDESTPMRRFGFGYGTLPGHVECGEERFLIEWDQHDNRVWYEIQSFSRPRHPLVRVAYPLARRLQRQFVRESLAQMKQLVADVPLISESRTAECARGLDAEIAMQR